MTDEEFESIIRGLERSSIEDKQRRPREGQASQYQEAATNWGQHYADTVDWPVEETAGQPIIPSDLPPSRNHFAKEGLEAFFAVENDRTEE